MRLQVPCDFKKSMPEKPTQFGKDDFKKSMPEKQTQFGKDWSHASSKQDGASCPDE